MLTLTIQHLWEKVGFHPNKNQQKAILHVDGPLFLTAGPGSGKTAVLVWRTLNLLVFHNVQPADIFLSTFTEKAAFQLQERLKTLLAIVSNETGQPFDLSKMALGTVHSICQRILSDRRFSQSGERPRPAKIMDELDQYFFLYDRRNWQEYTTIVGCDDEGEGNKRINELIGDSDSSSRHVAVTNCINLFNRFSEECLDPAALRRGLRVKDKRQILDLYARYRQHLCDVRPFGMVDLSLLQQEALKVIEQSPNSEKVFRHVIVDEYQDTNHVQEQIFFKLAKGSCNICIVGDDDQALYRFRGATVENLVEFESRCEVRLRVPPRRIDLDTNYRSRKHIVDFYTNYISSGCDWKRSNGKSFHRIHDKKIKPHRTDKHPCVVASTKAAPDDVYEEIAKLVKNLISSKKVKDPNQIAFLFPAMRGNDGPATRVKGFREALENLGMKVYAPRSGRFLDQDEALAVFGLFLVIFGRPEFEGSPFSQGLRSFYGWLSECKDRAKDLIEKDKQLAQYVRDKETEIGDLLEDYRKIMSFVKRRNWDLKAPFTLEMRRNLADIAGLSDRAKKSLSNQYFERVLRKRIEEGNPFTLKYVINRTTSLDWSVLDLFYQINGFKHFRDLYERAEHGEDEAPMFNLGIVSDYLARFMDKFGPVITASYLEFDKFQRRLFLSYLYALYRRQESEYEDADDPFPKGRIPFLSIHQSKGLEFPVVVLGTPFKTDRGPSSVEEITRELLGKEGEPLDRIDEFDRMRMFYVALSRPKNLLVIPHFSGQGQRISEPFKSILGNDHLPRIPSLSIDTIPEAGEDEDDLGANYSYTGDFLQYRKCPRQYMVFSKYGFVPSRSQTMFFGSLVHKTIEDLHYMLIENRKQVTP